MTRQEEIRNAIDKIIPISPSRNGRTYEQSLMATGFESGVNWADSNPKSPWISVDNDLPCNHREYVDLKYNSYTCQMLVRCKNGIYSVERMVMIFGRWGWTGSNDITHWMPIPKLKEE